MYCAFFWYLHEINKNNDNNELITLSKYFDILLLDPIKFINIAAKSVMLSFLFELLSSFFFSGKIVSYIVPLIALLSGDSYRRLYW
jgi:hypothetical protein